ncbi:TIGR02611 family protein [Plantactinospora sp. B24E8]|uniref:TIGR02611 family protein n=1 Tax=Plantactinospora sp. B24E8 TaxID=3153567 RepID=UPI00325F4886
MEKVPPTGMRVATGDLAGGGAVGKGRRYDVPEDQRVPRGDRPTSPTGDHPSTVAAESGAAGGVRTEPAPRWRRIRTTLEIIRANPTGRITLKVAVAVAGAIVVLLGLALIPLPGPGWLIVIGGLGIWAVEFHWAKRLLNFTRRHVQSWARWVREQSLLVRMVLGSVGLVFVAVVLWLSLRASLGIDVLARFMHYIATH